MTTQTTSAHDYELVLERTFDAPPALIFRAWTSPKLLTQWWAPKPLTTPICEIDPHPGGVFHTVMRAPDGKEYDTQGVFLEVGPNRIVFTDALAAGWKPAGKPFMVAKVDFEDIGKGKTKYTARAMHWTAEDREAHEKMGFHKGWAQCADQLADLLATL